ncbi:MAG: DUF5723 family protein [Bacteroidota bacterium]
MRKILIIPVVFYWFILPFQSIAQADMTSYFMDRLPQSNIENPAMIPDLRYHFSIPGLSSIYAEVANSGFHFNDVIENRNDSSYLLLDELINEKLRPSNHMAIHYQHELLSVGFKANQQLYFSFGVREHADFRFIYPKELLSLPYNGNGAYLDETVELSPLSIQATHYREYALGAAWEKPESWSAGLRVKLLFAMANAWSEEAYASLTTSSEGYTLNAEAEMLGHLTLPPGLDIDSLDNADPDLKDYLMNTANRGVGIDLGFNYFVNEDFSVSASILDLGAIRFDKNNYNYNNARTSVVFEGFDAYDYTGNNDSLIEEDIQNTLDSIADKFNIQESNNSYSMPLTTRFYLGGQYKINDRQKAGLLFRGQFFDDAFWPALTASYQRQFGRSLTMTASYSVAHNSYNNIGLGAALNMGALQFYMISDNWLAAIIPEKTKFFNLRFGFNIAARHKKPEKPTETDSD